MKLPETMNAVVMEGPGGPEVLSVATRPRPTPGPGEVAVRIRSSGVNRADLVQRMGNYPVPPGWPEDILGLEFVGTIEALGEGVGDWALGDAVMGIVGGGGYAESVVTHGSTVVRVPEGLDVLEAGAIPEVFMTAFDAVWRQMGLRTGETLLIHAVGSGVGTAALQMGAAFGCRVIGTSRTPEKLDRAVELGLEHPVLADGDWTEDVLERTEGRGVDVILDLVGASYLTGNQKVMARQGRHVVVGVPSGREATVDLRLLMVKRGRIQGTVLRARPTQEKAELARDFERDVLPLFESGRIRPVIDRVLPAAEVAEAHRLLEANATFGKVLLEWC